MALEVWRIPMALREAWRAVFSREVAEMVRRVDRIVEDTIRGGPRPDLDPGGTITLGDIARAVAEMRRATERPDPPRGHRLAVAGQEMEHFLRSLAAETEEVSHITVDPVFERPDETRIVVRFAGDLPRRGMLLMIERGLLPGAGYFISVYRLFRRQHQAALRATRPPPPWPAPPVTLGGMIEAEFRQLIVSEEEVAQAITRSIELLRKHLTPAQREEFDKTGGFHVAGNHTSAVYHIRYANGAFNVVRGPVAYCFKPQGIHWPGDIMLAQKIALENDELTAIAIANAAPNPRMVRRL